MTNEELAIHIADGKTNLIGELYQQNRGLLYKHAYRFYVLHSDRCMSAGVTLDDMMNECYFAVSVEWAVIKADETLQKMIDECKAELPDERAYTR